MKRIKRLIFKLDGIGTGVSSLKKILCINATITTVVFISGNVYVTVIPI